MLTFLRPPFGRSYITVLISNLLHRGIGMSCICDAWQATKVLKLIDLAKDAQIYMSPSLTMQSAVLSSKQMQKRNEVEITLYNLDFHRRKSIHFIINVYNIRIHESRQEFYLYRKCKRVKKISGTLHLFVVTFRISHGRGMTCFPE